MGRPSSFTQQAADEICARLMEGQSLRGICADEGMPGQRTVYQWLMANDAFAQQYARAREVQADVLVDEILEIADDGTNDKTVDPETGDERIDYDVIARSRLRVDARKWLAGKLRPKVYGDKVQQEITGKDGGPIETADVTATDYKALRAQIDAKRKPQ